MSHDRSGRVPFAIIAVLVLLCSIVTGAYIQQVSNEKRRLSGGDTEIGSLVPALREQIERIALDCLKKAVDGQTSVGAGAGPQAMWRVNSVFRELFGARIAQQKAFRVGNTGLAVTGSSFQAGVSAVPGVFRTMNPFGMAVNVSAPAALRAIGAVALTFKEGAGPRNLSVDFDAQANCWYPFTLSQANRLRRDCVNEGLMELLMKEMLRGYLERSMPDWKRQRNAASSAPEWSRLNLDAQCREALEYAMSIEHQVLFGQACGSNLSELLSMHPEVRFRVASAIAYPPCDQWPAPSWSDVPGDGEMAIDLGEFHDHMSVGTPRGAGLDRDDLYFSHNSHWKSGPSITTKKMVYAGEEMMVDVYSLEAAINGIYVLETGPRPGLGGQPSGGNKIDIEIPVLLEFQVDWRVSEAERVHSESGRDHCQIENLTLFDREFARSYRAPVNLTLDITNCSGVQVGRLERPYAVDIIVDGVPAGRFRRPDFRPGGLVLTNVPSGPHDVDVMLNYDDGDGERGEATGSFEAPAGSLKICTDSGADTQQLTTLILAHISKSPCNLRLIKTLELLSAMAGYVMPPDVRNICSNDSGSLSRLLFWLHGFEGYLGALEAFSGAIDTSTRALVDDITATTGLITDVVELFGHLVADWEIKGLHRPGSFSLLGVKVAFDIDAATKVRTVKLTGETSYSSATIVWEKPEKAQKYTRTGGEHEEEWGFEKTETRAQRLCLGFESAIEIANILNSVLSFWSKSVDYSASDGSGPATGETLDLSLDAVEIAIDLIHFFTGTLGPLLFKDVSEKAARQLKVMNEVLCLVGAVISLVQICTDQAKKFQNDPFFWEDLLTGGDEDTWDFYLGLTSVVIGAVSAAAAMGAFFGTLSSLAAIAPWLGPIGAIVMVIGLLVMVIYNWDAITSWAGGWVPGEQQDEAVASMEESLNGSLGTIASLNGMKTDGMLLSARQSRGVAFLMGEIAFFVDDPLFCFELQNMSAFTYDMARAKEGQALAANALRFFLIALWKQADDFLDDDTEEKEAKEGTELGDRHRFPDIYGITDFTWDGDLVVSDPSRGWAKRELTQPEIEDFLLGLAVDGAKNVSVSYRLASAGKISSEGMSQWISTVTRVSDQVSRWQGRLERAQAMSRYVSGLDSRAYNNDWGYLPIKMSAVYDWTDVRIAPHDGRSAFRFIENGQEISASSCILRVVQNNVPAGVYLEPGEYHLDYIDRSPARPLAKTDQTVKVYEFIDPGFCSGPGKIYPKARPVFFNIQNSFNGNVSVGVVARSLSGEAVGNLFSPDARRVLNITGQTLGPLYMDESWIPQFGNYDDPWAPADAIDALLRTTINISIGLDGDFDGDYEEWEYKNINVKDIRDDHKRVMKEQDGKKNDQLEYRLSIFNGTVETPDGRVVHSKWERIG